MHIAMTCDLVFLSGDEWDNDTMLAVARDWFARHPACQFVNVYEHAGWNLTFNRAEVCVGSANHEAVFPPGTVRPTGYSGRSERRGVRDCGCGCAPSTLRLHRLPDGRLQILHLLPGAHAPAPLTLAATA